MNSIAPVRNGLGLSTLPFRRHSLTLSVLLSAWVILFAVPAKAATFTVTNTNNGNAGSLRAAINDARQLAGMDTIRFAIPGPGSHTIVLTSDLPVLTGPLTVDGYSQPGARAATNTSTAELMIAIDASGVLRGIEIGAGVELRGLAIHSAQAENVFIEGGGNVVAGNHIGTNLAGDAADQYDGCNVTIYSSGNLVGGDAFADRNVIAGRGIEVCVKGVAHEIRNNRIGTNASGTAALGFSYGVMVYADGNLVRDNLVSGLFVGIEVLGDRNTLHGNRVGTNADGTAAISSGLGINIEGGDYNTIGGTGPGEGNLISGNEFGGIQLEHGDDPPEEEVGPAEGNQVLGNLIGTDVSGNVPLGNGVGFGCAGVSILWSNDNIIGGHEPSAGNVIAANEGHGVYVGGTDATDNFVLGNAIGTNMAGGLGLGNGQSGIRIDSGYNQVGEEEGASMNTIAYNGDDGVTITDTAPGNTVVRNLIFVNGTSSDDLGIDLGDDGVTANDAYDVDTGANDLLNHPLITAANAEDGTVAWKVDGLSSSFFLLEFYASTLCDGSGSGEGQRYLGSVVVQTNTKGRVAGLTATATPPVAGDYVTMTATRKQLVLQTPIDVLDHGPLFTSVLLETSEFSPCRLVE